MERVEKLDDYLAMTNLDDVLKSRDITLPTKVHTIKAMVFPVVMYRCKSWTIRRAEHRRTEAMTSSPIPSWQIDGEKVETVTYFIFLCSKITVDGDCSHEIKRRLLLGRKAMTNLDSILKSRNVTWLTKSI